MKGANSAGFRLKMLFSEKETMEPFVDRRITDFGVPLNILGIVVLLFFY